MKKNYKYICIAGILFSIIGISVLTAFEWPQVPFQASALFSEVRGDTFNTGMVFSVPGEVFAAEEGNVVMILEAQDSNMGWFQSPLGNTVIVAHKNDMMSVYSNLVNIKVSDTKASVKIGDVLGVSGYSSWSIGSEGAGFQVIDTKMKTLINPIVLMKDSPESSRIVIEGVSVENGQGESFPMYNGASFKSGAYTLYMKRPEAGMLHSSSVSLNGEAKEKINYDTLEQENNKLTIYGNKSYSFDEVYPQKERMRLAEVLLSRGTNTIEVTLTNVGGTQSFARYRVIVN